MRTLYQKRLKLIKAIILAYLLSTPLLTQALSGPGQWALPTSLMPSFQKGICNGANSANPGIVWPTAISSLTYQSGTPGCLSIQYVHDPAIVTIQGVTAQHGQCTVDLFASQSSLGKPSFTTKPLHSAAQGLEPAKAIYMSKNSLTVDSCTAGANNTVNYIAECNPNACPATGLASCSFDQNGNEVDVCNTILTLIYDRNKGSCVPPSCFSPAGPQTVAPLLYLDSQCTQPLPASQYTVNADFSITLKNIAPNLSVYTGGPAPTKVVLDKNGRLKSSIQPSYQCQGPYNSTTPAYGCGAINYGAPPPSDKILVKTTQALNNICYFSQVYLADKNCQGIGIYPLDNNCAALIPAQAVAASSYIQGQDSVGCVGDSWPPVVIKGGTAVSTTISGQDIPVCATTKK